MARRKAAKRKAKPRKKAEPKPKEAWFVCVYEIRDFGGILLPGDVLKVPLEEVKKWEKYIEHRALLRVKSENEALAQATAIHDGSFVLSEEVASKKHSMAHGGFGKPKESKKSGGDRSIV